MAQTTVCPICRMLRAVNNQVCWWCLMHDQHNHNGKRAPTLRDIGKSVPTLKDIGKAQENSHAGPGPKVRD